MARHTISDRLSAPSAVFQDFSRSDYTVRDNIEVANRTGSETKFAAALRNSGFDVTLFSLPGGVDARLGKAFGGTELSGGWWQKLATACALYRDVRVLILDEPTAALDPRSESEVFADFRTSRTGRRCC